MSSINGFFGLATIDPTTHIETAVLPDAAAMVASDYIAKSNTNVTVIDIPFKLAGGATMSAMDVRREVLRLMGMDEDEIEEQCDASRFPANLEEELADLEAMRRVQIRNARVDSK